MSTGPLRKDFAVFDCDAHINDPRTIWTDYVEPEYREAVRAAYWQDERQTILNGRTVVIGGQSHEFPTYNPICIAGPGMNKKIMRRLQQMGLDAEQKKYVEHQGAYDPHARIRDMDLMGIDQVMIIPTMMVAHFPFVESAEGAHGFARAYNNWVRDFCDAVPDRLYPAGWLPLQSPDYARQELERIAAKGFRVALIRPIDARRRYPNQIFPGARNGTLTNTLDKVFRAFEDTGVVCGMHTFPALMSEPSTHAVSPGDLIARAGALELGGKMVDVQTLSFVFEAVTWLAQVLLSGFLEMYPRLRMAIFESNASWLPELLEHCDRLYKLYANERLIKSDRLPSEAFAEQCFIAFESDEEPVFRQWDRFADTGIWSSDCYHHDGSDSWSAIRRMGDAGVPSEVVAKMLGVNARRMYGIEGKVFVREEAPLPPRPDWFPNGEELERWAAVESDPRAHGVTQSIDFSKLDPRMIMSALRSYYEGRPWARKLSKERRRVARKLSKVAARRLTRESRNGHWRHGFPVVDADSHVFEPPAIWEKYLAREYRVIARSAFGYHVGASGMPSVTLNGRAAKPMNLSKINRQAIWRPGMRPEDIGALDPDETHAINPGASDPKRRLADMDALGIDQAVLFPTLFAEYFPMVESPDVAAALARAYNDWIWDFSRAARKRLIPVAVLPVQDVDLALGELRRVAKRGFRAAFLRPCFVGRAPADSSDTIETARFPNHPSFDPLWRELEALDVIACVHPSAGSTNPEWSCEGAFVERVAAPLRTGHHLAESVAPMMDNAILLTAMLFYAHLERFPKLRLAFHHSGASWVTLALEKAETYLWLLSNFKDVSLEPEHVFFARDALVTFDTWESSVARLPDTYGRLAAWGSRYPHHDASPPDEAIANLRKWNPPDDVVAGYMGGNAARHFGL